MLDVFLTVVAKLLFATAADKSRGLNQQSARQFPSWALFILVVVCVTAAALGIAVLVSQTIQLLAA